MSKSRPSSVRLPFLGCLVVVGTVVAMPGVSRAQLQSVDPYDPYGAMYRGSTYPGYLSDPSYYNRPIYRPGPTSANQMDSYYRGLNGGASRSASPFNGLGSSADMLGRYDARGRLTPPASEADEQLARDQQLRDDLYFKALGEKDPAKRADYYRQSRELDEKLSRLISPNRKAVASTSSTSSRIERYRPVIRDKAPAVSGGTRSSTPSAVGAAARRTPALPTAPSTPRPPGTVGSETARALRNPGTLPSAVIRRARESQRPASTAPPVPGLRRSGRSTP